MQAFSGERFFRSWSDFMRRDEVSLTDMRNAARRALDYVNGMTRDEFVTDQRTKAAVVREMEIMGEAAVRISQAFRDTHPTIPWSVLCLPIMSEPPG